MNAGFLTTGAVPSHLPPPADEGPPHGFILYPRNPSQSSILRNYDLSGTLYYIRWLTDFQGLPYARACHRAGGSRSARRVMPSMPRSKLSASLACPLFARWRGVLFSPAVTTRSPWAPPPLYLCASARKILNTNLAEHSKVLSGAGPSAFSRNHSSGRSAGTTRKVCHSLPTG